MPETFDFDDPLLADAVAGFLAPRPALSEAQLAQILLDGWGLSGTLTDLGGERDCNALVTLPDGRKRVLKVFSPDEPAPVRHFQHRVMIHLEQRGMTLAPRLYPTLSGAPEHPVTADTPLYAALIDLMPGQAPQPDGTAAQLRMIGRGIAEFQLALRDLDSTGSERLLLWDQMNALRLRDVARQLDDARLHPGIERAMAHLDRRLPEIARLPSQLIHNDLSQSNLLVSETEPHTLSGIFDFGDMVVAPRINDLAIAATYFTDPTLPIAPQLAQMVAAYEELVPLSDEELEALPDAMLARMMLRLIIPLWRSALFPANRAYLLRHFDAGTALANQILPHKGASDWVPFAFNRRLMMDLSDD